MQDFNPFVAQGLAFVCCRLASNGTLWRLVVMNAASFFRKGGTHILTPLNDGIDQLAIHRLQLDTGRHQGCRTITGGRTRGRGGHYAFRLVPANGNGRRNTTDAGMIALRTTNQPALNLIVKILGTSKPSLEGVTVFAIQVVNDHWMIAGNACPKLLKQGEGWCPGRESNPYTQRARDFKSLVSTNFTTRAWEVCMILIKKGKAPSAFPFFWSGRRVSNSRPIPWQGIALPTELLPHRKQNAIIRQRWYLSTIDLNYLIIFFYINKI